MSITADSVLERINAERKRLGITDAYNPKRWLPSERQFQKSKNGSKTREEIGEPLDNDDWTDTFH